jgi:hypothetical protein
MEILFLKRWKMYLKETSEAPAINGMEVKHYMRVMSDLHAPATLSLKRLTHGLLDSRLDWLPELAWT